MSKGRGRQASSSPEKVEGAKVVEPLTTPTFTTTTTYSSIPTIKAMSRGRRAPFIPNVLRHNLLRNEDLKKASPRNPLGTPNVPILHHRTTKFRRPVAAPARRKYVPPVKGEEGFQDSPMVGREVEFMMVEWLKCKTLEPKVQSWVGQEYFLTSYDSS